MAWSGGDGLHSLGTQAAAHICAFLITCLKVLSLQVKRSTDHTEQAQIAALLSLDQ